MKDQRKRIIQMIIKPTGTNDFFPKDTQKLQYIEDTAKRVAAKFGFGEIRFPTFEFTELFARGVGSTTDVVQKEMYTFIDRDGESITLRPEGTAGVARAIVENGVYGDAMPLKYYYISNFFQRRVQHRNISLSIEPQLDIFLAVISHLKDCGVNIDRADAQIDTRGENKKATIDFSVRGIKQAQKIIKSLESVEGILNIKYNS